ncbi:MAG: hypothetical protein ACYDCL_04715 [Myxococcales bacterium]
MRAVLALFLFAAAACSGPAPRPGDGGEDGGRESGCLSGAAYPCDCDGGPTGAMLCQDDGGFGPCQCPVPAGDGG